MIAYNPRLIHIYKWNRLLRELITLSVVFSTEGSWNHSICTNIHLRKKNISRYLLYKTLAVIFIKSLQIFSSFDIWEGIIHRYTQCSWILYPNNCSFSGQFPTQLLRQLLSLSSWDWENVPELRCSTERKQEWIHCPSDVSVVLYIEPFSKSTIRSIHPWRCGFSAWIKCNHFLFYISWTYLERHYLPL